MRHSEWGKNGNTFLRCTFFMNCTFFKLLRCLTVRLIDDRDNLLCCWFISFVMFCKLFVSLNILHMSRNYELKLAQLTFIRCHFQISNCDDVLLVMMEWIVIPIEWLISIYCKMFIPLIVNKMLVGFFSNNFCSLKITSQSQSELFLLLSFHFFSVGVFFLIHPRQNHM